VKVVKVHEAKTTLSKLIEQALAGEEIIIARDDTPVVHLVPLAAQAPRRVFGTLKGKLQVTPAFFEPLPSDELAPWSE
jgi:antitoxin (DNA-binding transcriptional repressor) of toxin-antitoxin stability system